MFVAKWNQPGRRYFCWSCLLICSGCNEQWQNIQHHDPMVNQPLNPFEAFLHRLHSTNLDNIHVLESFCTFFPIFWGTKRKNLMFYGMKNPQLCTVQKMEGSHETTILWTWYTGSEVEDLLSWIQHDTAIRIVNWGWRFEKDSSVEAWFQRRISLLCEDYRYSIIYPYGTFVWHDFTQALPTWSQRCFSRRWRDSTFRSFFQPTDSTTSQQARPPKNMFFELCNCSAVNRQAQATLEMGNSARMLAWYTGREFWLPF